MEVSSDEETEVQPWLNDSEFLQKCRMSRKNFDRILLRIKVHNVFKKREGRSGRPQTPVSHQLMFFLKMLGTEGAGVNGPNQRNTFMIGKGTSTMFCRGVTQAILSMREESHNWPDAEERKKLARIAFEDCGLPCYTVHLNCPTVCDADEQRL